MSLAAAQMLWARGDLGLLLAGSRIAEFAFRSERASEGRSQGCEGPSGVGSASWQRERLCGSCGFSPDCQGGDTVPGKGTHCPGLGTGHSVGGLALGGVAWLPPRWHALAPRCRPELPSSAACRPLSLGERSEARCRRRRAAGSGLLRPRRSQLEAWGSESPELPADTVLARVGDAAAGVKAVSPSPRRARQQPLAEAEGLGRGLGGVTPVQTHTPCFRRHSRVFPSSQRQRGFLSGEGVQLGHRGTHGEHAQQPALLPEPLSQW